jgi:XTP/dITP diphosphohydrolase
VLARGEGSIEGEILQSPRGTGGFGYDPLFYVPGERCTMAELDPGRKQHISHRGRALLQLLDTLGISKFIEGAR